MANRPIKFRAWHPDFGEMVYADMDNIIYEKREFMMMFDVGFSNYPESGWSIMQFTGLKDKNGKEIYEGDVITVMISTIGMGAAPEICTFEVKIEDGICNCSPRFMELQEQDCAEEILATVEWMEVIGNIHQNPELLIK